MDELYSMQEPLIFKLKSIIRFAVRLLAILMTLVILWGVIDVAWVLYSHLMDPPFMMLTISDILDTFGAFMAVLIAIEIFINITVYLQDDVIHVKIVMATALMAIARKVIILDFSKISSDYIWATAALVLAMSLGYWLILKWSEHEETKIKRHLAKQTMAHADEAEDGGHQQVSRKQ
ncbi:phosphate-starvation-inducible PsiE family protein [Desulforhabdus amnigena]|jgi:uncharacterized membrane protein (DUF373 family)|uniref:Phosphate-starvation-inducible PsiE family protein n=1 Tax=Desulforhabdus amnigena TaxID=40218 RepID=A0A9W6LA57_9BACT|nr:phosphate-starvation-inducible PsiE family protein [Desulforhabdus amnigena]NLJ26728.1 phosphate-starvation-inducible PsiE family protein [Deltaproteobacteria bacterium]GLI36014.1 hypothetical protein DAMNIGENAA_34470 [Desulforhabdus amnigena]